MPDQKDYKDKVLNIQYTGLVCVLLVIAILISYWQVTNHDFINFDDDDYITDNSHVRAGLTNENIKWALTASHASNWHPLTWLSHMLDIQLFGLDSGRHHLISLIFHIVNSLLLFLILKRMTGAFWQSCFVAALFALHPLNVESVAWVSERKSVLSTLFWFLTMGSYALYAEHPKAVRYVPVFLFLMLGLAAKPMLVTLPFALLLLDYWPLGRFQFEESGTVINEQQKAAGPQLILEKLPLFALVLLSSTITFYAQKKGGAVSSLDIIPLKARTANALVSYVSYLGKMIWPSNMAVMYPHPGMPPWWKIAGAVMVLACISCLAIRSINKRPYVAVGWFWYLGTLVPVIGLVQVGSQAMADRYTYIPLIGIFIIIAWIVAEFAAQWPHRKIWLATLATVLVSVLMAMTWKQVGYWKNSITLYEHALAVTDNNFMMHNNLGYVLAEHGEINKAVKHYSQAVKIKPSFFEAHNNIGNALLKQGKAAESIRYFNKALRLNPKFVEAYNNLGVALVRVGKIEEAIVRLQKALQINPDFAGTHVNLGGVLTSLGRIDEAIVHFRKALKIKPYIPEVHVNLGVALANKGKVAEAVTHFRKALQLDPDNAEARYNLNKTPAISQKIDEEIIKIQSELTLKPQDPRLHFDLGNMYKTTGQLNKAEDYYNKAIALQPEFPEALYELAKLSIIQKEYEKALSLYQKIIAFLPDNPAVYYNIACIYARQNKPEESVAWLKKAVAKDFNDWKHIKTDSDLDNIRSSLQYKEFAKGH